MSLFSGCTLCCFCFSWDPVNVVLSTRVVNDVKINHLSETEPALDNNSFNQNNFNHCSCSLANIKTLNAFRSEYQFNSFLLKLFLVKKNDIFNKDKLFYFRVLSCYLIAVTSYLDQTDW